MSAMRRGMLMLEVMLGIAILGMSGVALKSKDRTFSFSLRPLLPDESR
jgi:hypothetical protein